MSNPEYQYIIIGQGLAGSLLAWHLQRAKQSVLIIDNNHKTSSSTVAAGLINPVTGLRLRTDKLCKDYLEHAYHLYQNIEQQLKIRYLNKNNIIRIIQSNKQVDFLRKRKTEHEYRDLLGNYIVPNTLNDINDSFGSVEQFHTGFIDTEILLNGLRNYFANQQQFIQQDINYENIVKQKQSFSLSGYKAKNIIFCEGYKAMENPWFSDLPFQPAKGEIISIKTSVSICKNIINANKWIIPLGNNTYKVGSTHEWQFSDSSVSNNAKYELEKALRSIFNKDLEFSICNQQAGIRPCSMDKMPFIGLHKKYDNLGIFNGFGSKGSLLIPYYAHIFTQFLLKKGPLPDSVDIARFSY